ncbi:hypothetical protein ACFVWN_01390 [Nocardiopsis flavescens]|uniref:hypothetical protein n=1 Tax=Nocardiopsis flavescens TaxID=758803 RepID=UPI0036602332
MKLPLLPAAAPANAEIAIVEVSPRRAYLYLLAGSLLTLATQLTNPGGLSWVGGLAAVGVLCWMAHRAGFTFLTAIDLTIGHCHTPSERLRWARTGAAALVWAVLILGCAVAVEVGVRVLLGGAYTMPPGGTTVLVPAVAPTMAVLTSTLLRWAGLHRAEAYMIAGCIAVGIGLIAQGVNSVPGALPLAAATVGLAWLYQRTHRGIALYIAYLGVLIAITAALRFVPGL